MKTFLQKFTNILTIAATLFLVIGMGYVIKNNQPIGDFISEAALCYVAIAAFNYLMFGYATLWHRKNEI